jgi:hypothetical protein
MALLATAVTWASSGVQLRPAIRHSTARGFHTTEPLNPLQLVIPDYFDPATRRGQVKCNAK